MDQTNQTEKIQLKTEKKSSWSDFFTSHWFVILLVLSFILAVVSIFIRSMLPETTPVGENTWNNITPGFTNYNQLVEKMGPPLESVETKDGFDLKYQSDFLAIPNRVVTDKDGKVQFIKEFLKYDENHLLKQYTDKYGNPDLVLTDPESGPAVEAHVFLKQGLVIIAHVNDGSVEQKWYFSPTTRQNFLSSWGKKLSDDGPQPEEPF